MQLLISTLTISGTLTIAQVELLQYTPSSLASGQYVYETTDDTEINKLLNDYEHVVATVTNNVIKLDFSSASEDPNARAIAASDWKTKVRPALMRANTATHFFNL